MRSPSFTAIGLALACLAPRPAQSQGSLAQRVQQIVSRPEFRHSIFGVAFLSLDTGKPAYAYNADKFFVPASTTKLLTEGTTLALLGADYRFTTRVYRTGTLDSSGSLEGDIILVAGGDPNLSNRIQPDGTLAFQNVDHAYDGSPDTKAVPGDPLLVIREMARQIKQRGVRRVGGRVRVDASLFPEGERELGTGVVISPVVVNDNLIDVVVGPGAQPGDPAVVTPSPATAYARFINLATTGAADSRPLIRWSSDVANEDGTHTVTVTGSVPAGKPSILYSYAVPEPSRYAAVVLAEALVEQGVAATWPARGDDVDFAALASRYTPDAVVAEHVSPPLREEIKVTLKVSQNLHSSSMPYVLGALVAHQGDDQAGFDLEHDFLQKAGLDLSGATQGDGAGGAAHFTPDFMVHYLAYMATRPDFPVFHDALPILGKDGTLWNIQTNSPAAGKVHAKTGTFGEGDNLNHQVMVNGKGLAGYVTTADGRRLAFAIYANNVAVTADDPDAVTRIVGQALGEIAAAGYSARR
jgi:D-alanyl-D-alanine carboxypeptidase/D-alanyl-D-alanine-endopeptidase (penicillin-binding protein 4)